jgi:hypothetical protein
MLKRALLALVLIGGLLSLLWLAVSQSTTSKSLTNAGPSTTSSVPSKEAVSAKLADLNVDGSKTKDSGTKGHSFLPQDTLAPRG